MTGRGGAQSGVDKAPETIAKRVVECCPACGGHSFIQVGRPASPFSTDADTAVFWHPAYEINECVSCGLLFKSTTMPFEMLDGLYAQLDSKPYDYDTLLPTDRLVLAALEDLGPGTTVLDFGCNTGRLLARLPTSVRRLGIEVNERAATIARDRGIEMVAETDVRSGKWAELDAVVCMDVFEHLVQPVETLRALARSLRPGGRLVIVTGNADAITTRDYLAEFWYFRLAGHLQMLTGRHLEWLAANLRLDLAAVSQSCHYEPSITERLRQRTQAAAYFRFKRAPQSLVARIMSTLPVLRRAEHWRSSPSLTCTADHVVAVFRTPTR